jgi:hypothetical protein
MATVAGYAPTIVSFWPFMREFECPIWFEILAIGHTTSKTWFLTWVFTNVIGEHDCSISSNSFRTFFAMALL